MRIKMQKGLGDMKLYYFIGFLESLIKAKIICR